jgi:hypothetical protein
MAEEPRRAGLPCQEAALALEARGSEVRSNFLCGATSLWRRSGCSRTAGRTTGSPGLAVRPVGQQQL